MKNLFCLMVLFFSIPAYAYNCNQPGNAFDEFYCDSKTYFRLDDELIQTYNFLTEDFDKSDKALLEKEQKVWIQERNSSCTFVTEDGEESIVISCAIKKTRERLDYLKERYNIWLSQQKTGVLSENPQMNSFLKKIENALNTHSWQDIIEAARPDNYRMQVVEFGMNESQYIAELFSLSGITKSLERIKVVYFIHKIELKKEKVLSGFDEYYNILGTVVLYDNTYLRLSVRVVKENGRYWLTGGVG